MVVSSFETRSTQSNGSPIGSESRIAPARSRICGAIWASRAGATAGLTVLRWTSCSGGSMAMKLGAFCAAIWAWASGGSTLDLGGRPMPLAEEKTSWLVSISTMSLYLVIDQNGP